MKFKHRRFGFKLKSIDAKGAFTGYGSVFNNTDMYRDVILPGAFAATLREWAGKDAYPPILWQHDSDQPIGVFTLMREDATGLYVEGQLLIDDVQQASEAYALMKAKAITGMSIGYNVPDGGSEYDGETNVNKLTQVELWEISIVTFPANTEATITTVKSKNAAGETPTLREFESLLRDVGGFSRKDAEQITKLGYSGFLALRDADGKDTIDERALADVLASIKSYVPPQC